MVWDSFCGLGFFFLYKTSLPVTEELDEQHLGNNHHIQSKQDFFRFSPILCTGTKMEKNLLSTRETRAAVGPCHSSTVQASLDCSSCADGQKSRYNVRGRDKTTAQYKLLSEKNPLTVTKRGIYAKNVCPLPVSLITSTRKELLLAAACSVIWKGSDLFERAPSVPTTLTLISLPWYFVQTALPKSQHQETGLKQTRTIFPRFWREGWRG